MTLFRYLNTLKKAQSGLNLENKPMSFQRIPPLELTLQLLKVILKRTRQQINKVHFFLSV